MKKRKIMFLIALNMAIILCSCSNVIKEAEKEFTPYATEEVLTNLINEGYVNYRTSRYFACIAMHQFEEENSWYKTELSEYPIVIFNSKGEKPRYYEFRVLKDGKEIGAIACVTEEQDGEPVQYVMPYALKISNEDSRAISTTKSKITDVGYPAKISVSNVNSRSTELSANSSYEDIKVKEFLELIDDDMKKELQLDEEKYNAILKEQEEAEKELQEYWNFINENEKLILATTDEEIAQVYEEMKAATSRGVKKTVTENSFFPEDWKDKCGWGNCGGWCGPYCVTFITLLLGEESGYKNVPKYDNYFQTYNMYKEFENKIGTGPKLLSQLSSGLQSLTNYKIENDFSHIFKTIDMNIRDTNLPSVSLRSSKGLSSDDIQWHYRVIVGTKSIATNTKVTLGKLTLLNYTTHDNYYIMHDNGSDYDGDDGYFFEKSTKIYQFWSAHVEKK